MTGDHDIETKTRAIKGFLESGHCVQVKMKFQNREISHKELGFNIIHGILEKLTGVAKYKDKPTLMGKFLICTFEPTK